MKTIIKPSIARPTSTTDFERPVALPKRSEPGVAVVACNPMNADISNGILMRSLFEGWSQHRLAQVYFPVTKGHEPDFDVCQNYQIVTATGRTVHRMHVEDELPNCSDTTTARWQQQRKLLETIKRRPGLVRWFRMAQEVWYSQRWLESSLQRALQRIRPDVVYALLGHYFLTRITTRVCQRLKLPLVIHVTDDFVTSAYEHLPCKQRFQQASRDWFQQAVGYATERLAVSPVMAQAYEDQYGGDWHWFTTLVSPSAFCEGQRPTDNHCLRLVYAGNLGLNRWQVLRDLGFVLQRIAAGKGVNTELDIYAPTEQLAAWGPALAACSAIRLKGWLNSDELPDVFRQADVLVHVESDDPANFAYVKYSMSTKLSQYLMSGRCVLGIGPPQAGSLRIIRMAGAGLVVANQDLSETTPDLEQLLIDTNARHSMGRGGWEWATRNVSTMVRRREFQCLLRHAASNVPSHRRSTCPDG